MTMILSDISNDKYKNMYMIKPIFHLITHRINSLDPIFFFRGYIRIVISKKYSINTVLYVLKYIVSIKYVYLDHKVFSTYLHNEWAINI